MTRGGEEIYVGPLGQQSLSMINYFEVGLSETMLVSAHSLLISKLLHSILWRLRNIMGVSKIEDGYNPATWALEVTTKAQEDILGVKFADIYKNSDLYMLVI